MSDERLVTERPQAGGPRVYLSSGFLETEAELLALLPDSDGTAIAPDAKVFLVELDTVVATDAVTVGGQALAFVAADPGDGEVLLGSDDEDAATNLAAAINALAISGVTAEAGGAQLAIRSATNAALTCTTSDTTITITDLGGWVFLPETDESVTVNFLEKHQDIVPVYLQQRSSSVITQKGVDSVGFNFPRRSLDAMSLILTQCVKSSTAASATAVAKDYLKLNADPAPVVYRHLIQVMKGDNGYWQFHIYPKVSPVGEIKQSYGNDVTKLSTDFKVYAHDGCGTTLSKVFTGIEMTGPKTS